MSDTGRLARFLTGTSIGLVLGGGGEGNNYMKQNQAECQTPVDLLDSSQVPL